MVKCRFFENPDGIGTNSFTFSYRDLINFNSFNLQSNIRVDYSEYIKDYHGTLEPVKNDGNGWNRFILFYIHNGYKMMQYKSFKKLVNTNQNFKNAAIKLGYIDLISYPKIKQSLNDQS